MKRNLISILLPVRNAESFLSACLESIQNQTETNWELIAIDDHSTDRSFEILNSFSKEMPNKFMFSKMKEKESFRL